MNDTEIIAALWQRYRTRALDLVDVLRSYVGGDGDRDAALTAAHKLAGSLGSYGRHDGSRLALELESRLRVDAPGTHDETMALVDGLRIALD